MAFLKDFKTFATKGNLVDVAIAFLIGSAFGKLISSFTDGLISPILGLLTGGVDFKAMSFKIGEADFKWGAFLNEVISFLIVAFVCYLFIKAVLKRDPNAAVPLSPTEKLLMEIRDSLKK
jgi:large conductance mechanosensitive channel